MRFQSANSDNNEKPFYMDCPIDFTKRPSDARGGTVGEECDEEDLSKDYIHLVETLTRESAERIRDAEELGSSDDEIGAFDSFSMLSSQ